MGNETKTYTATVIWFKNGYGFLSTFLDENGIEQPEIFVHYSDIVCQGYKVLYKGQKVSFAIGQNNTGRAKAISVTILPTQ